MCERLLAALAGEARGRLAADAREAALAEAGDRLWALARQAPLQARGRGARGAGGPGGARLLAAVAVASLLLHWSRTALLKLLPRARKARRRRRMAARTQRQQQGVVAARCGTNRGQCPPGSAVASQRRPGL